MYHDVLAKRASHELASRGHDVAEVRSFRLEDLPARESQQLARQLGRLQAGVADLLRALGDMRRCRLVFDDGVCISQHDRQDIVEVVRDTARQLTDRLHLLGLQELLAGPPVAVHHLRAHAGLQRDPAVEEDGTQRQQQDERGDQGGYRREERFIEAGDAAFLTGNGKAIGRCHRRVVHRRHGKTQDQRADPFTHAAGPRQAHLADPFASLKGEDGQQHGDDDGGREKCRIVAQQCVEPNRRHARVMHRPDSGTHQRAADQQSASRHHRAGDDVQGDARSQYGRHDRQGRDAGIVGNGDRQNVRQHADEMHGPDASAHRDGADRQPAEAQPAVPELGDPGGKLQEGIAAKRRNQIRQQNQGIVVRSRDGPRRLDVQSEEMRKSHRGWAATDMVRDEMITQYIRADRYRPKGCE